MDASGNWVALGDIRSDRDLVSGEQVQVMLVDRDSGDPVEEVRFSPLPDQQGQYGWTKFFCRSHKYLSLASARRCPAG
ncbi:hypothetical protein [Pseudomonas viridiflava]|uniref:hypothetical protein n=1 Tax=Pseudomonas viridiflava TaxID=33069 RepID=UPI002B1CFA1E|nr:hypothetical protein [Pseudomonas viridiflava]